MKDRLKLFSPPTGLVNGIASMSNYPSAKILQDFVKDMVN